MKQRSSRCLSCPFREGNDKALIESLDLQEMAQRTSKPIEEITAAARMLARQKAESGTPFVCHELEKFPEQKACRALLS